MYILVLSAQDRGGGAPEIAYRLAENHRRRGHRCRMVVGEKRSAEPTVIEIPDRGDGSPWATAFLGLRDGAAPLLGKVRGAGRLSEALHCLGRPGRIIDRLKGREDMNLPASHSLLDLAAMPDGATPELVHAHNLHSFRGPRGHFDLSALPALGSRIPIVLTMHDAWLTTGHCAHSMACERWLTGCGECPDLDLYPPVRRDGTACNWRRKRDIFAKGRFYVAAPCRWLLERTRRSILAPAIIESRVIPNGVDLGVFRPGDSKKARAALGLPQDAHILLFAAQGLKNSSWKDHATLRAAIARAGGKAAAEKIICIALGENLPREQLGGAEIRYIPYQKDRDTVADYYRAADIYLQASRMETFPNTILEAMASGRVVVATSVGGIPEQVSDETGRLVPPQDPEAMAGAILALLEDDGARNALGANARQIAEDKFDLEQQADAYLSWFEEIINSGHADSPERNVSC